MAVLRHLAAVGDGGERLTAIADAIGLNVSTTHRILRALERHGLVEREAATRRHRLGIALFSLGMQAADGTAFRRICRPALLRLSAATGETILLMARSGADTVCIDRQDGTYVIEPLARQIGGAIPLGVGCSSLSILAFLPQEEIEAILAMNAARYEQFGLTKERIRVFLPGVRKQGYAVTRNWLIDGISAVAMPIRPHGRDVVATFTIDMTTARLTPARLEELLTLLRREVTEIEKVLARG
ncbi:MAG TPA: IclR family transcriptional regulator [Alphaproteobacteria bacterium]|nr:IclR family transcriptional regulator [Alphaproteobacteria bacterium]